MAEREIFTTIRFKYSFESGIGEYDQERYVKTVNVEIVGENDVDGEFHIGTAKRYVLLLGQAINEDYSIEDVFDISGEICDFEDIYDFENYDFREDLEEQFGIDNSDLCIYSRAEILPKYRGYGIGKMLMKDSFNMLGPGCGLIVMKPYPLQFECRRDSEEDKEYVKRMGFDNMEHDMSKAFKGFKAYCKSIGFMTSKNYPDFMFLSTSQRNPKMDEIDLNDDTSVRGLRK